MAQIHSPDVIGLTIQDTTDITKEATWDVSAISASTTRTITMPDQNIDLTPGVTYASAGAAAAAYLYTDTPAIDPVGTGAGTLVIGDGADGGTVGDAIVIGNLATASANDAVALGINTNAFGLGAVAIGGRSFGGSQAGGDRSVAIGDADANATTGDFAVAIGSTATADGNQAVALGATANADNLRSIAIGRADASGGIEAIAVGDATASADNSMAIGFESNADRQGETEVYNKAFAPSVLPGTDARCSKFMSVAETTDNTTTDLIVGTGPTDLLTIASDSTVAFDILVSARRTDADNESAGFEIKGVIDNNAGTTAFVGSPQITTLGDDSGGVWIVAVIADNVNNALVVRVTGENLKTIRWVAVMQLSEVRG